MPNRSTLGQHWAGYDMIIPSLLALAPLSAAAQVPAARQIAAPAAEAPVRSGPVPTWVHQSDPLTAPADPNGAVFVNRQDILVHLDAQGQEQFLGYRVKILQPAGLELGNIAIAWNPAAGAPTVHGIVIHRGGAVIDVLKTAKFEILRREDQLEAAHLDGMLTAVLHVGDLRVDDEIEVAYSIRTKDPTLGNANAGMLFLAPNVSRGRYRIGISWDDGYKPALRISPDFAANVRLGDHAAEALIDNPAIVNPPKDAPPRYQLPRLIEFSQFPDWATVSRQLVPLFAEAAHLAPSSPIKAEARAIAAANPTASAQAAAALKLVQQNIRYIYVGLDRGNLTPASAEETWARRYGDCKGKTVLLLALLGELGIAAEPVLASNAGADDGLDQHLASPRAFDHVLVRATIDGKVWWLDGTLPAVVPPAAEPAVPYRWVLPLRTAGATLEHLPWHAAVRPDEVNALQIDARQGFDAPAKVTATFVVRGIKALQQQIQFSSVSTEQLTAAFRQNMGGEWLSVDDVQWHYDIPAAASVLKITGTWKLTWESDDGGARSLALPGGGFNPPDRRSRTIDQDQTAPFYNKPSYDCYATTVVLPTGTHPRQWASKPSFDQHIFGQHYHRAFSLSDGAIRMVRGFRVEETEIPAALARSDNLRIPAFDNSMGYIFYDPAGQSDPIPVTPTVPTANGINWAADTVPCLQEAGASAPRVVHVTTPPSPPRN